MLVGLSSTYPAVPSEYHWLSSRPRSRLGWPKMDAWLYICETIVITSDGMVSWLVTCTQLERCGMNRCLELLLISSIVCNCVGYDWKPCFHITPECGWLNDPHPAFSRGQVNDRKQTDFWMPYILDPRGLYHVFYQCNLNSTLPPWAPGQEGTRSFYAPINKYKLVAPSCMPMAW